MTRFRPGKPISRFLAPAEPGSPFAPIVKPVFGQPRSAKSSSRPLRMPLSEHLMAILKRERPDIAERAELERRFHPFRLWRFDLAWPEQKVAAECDGGIYSQGAHARGGHIESDAEKVSEAAAFGWRCLRLTRKMIDDGRAVDLIVRALAWKEEGH